MGTETNGESMSCLMAVVVLHIQVRRAAYILHSYTQLLWPYQLVIAMLDSEPRAELSLIY